MRSRGVLSTTALALVASPRLASLAGVAFGIMLAVMLSCFSTSVLATPLPNGATIETRTFNDCPTSTVTTTNSYPALIEITDAMDPLCLGFANLHDWSFSEDGGATAAVFNNNSNFRFGADFVISGAGEGVGGLRISPWWAKLVDGHFEVNATSGEVVVFGGRLPFYSFTANHAITYTRGTTIHLEMTYRANDLVSADPATIQYRVVYNGTTYDSPVLPFDQGAAAECDPNGLWGMLNDGRVGGYFQPRSNTGASLTATWSNMEFQELPAAGTPLPNGATIETRTFNDCPTSTVTTTNSYPALIEITDAMDPWCLGFANLHDWSFSEDGGATAAVFNNNSNFRFGADFVISGAGEGVGGLRISPWWAKLVDGHFEVNATSGEVVVFGGRLPFYSFTANHAITYTRGTTIHLEMTYRANDLVSADPATIQYRVVYNGTTYDSPVLPFDQGAAAECDPNGLWGMLNDGRVGGYFQPRSNTGASLTATWSNLAATVAPPAMTKAFGAANISLNQTTSLTFTITNPSTNSGGLTGVAFSDNLPAGLVVATPNGLANTCGGTATAVAGSGAVSLTGGTVAAGSICTVTVGVTGTALGNLINTTGAVSSTDGGTGNTATASLNVLATIPTLTEWGLIILAVLLGTGSVFYLRRRRLAA